MLEQAEGLTQETEDIKKWLMDAGNQKAKPEVKDEAPSQKELKEYTSKLQEEFLKSDQTIKVR